MSATSLAERVRGAEPRPAEVSPEPGEASERHAFLIIVGGTALIVLAVFAPLLRSGTLYQLDSPANLIGPHPRLLLRAWGDPAELTARAPIEWCLMWLYRAVPWGQVRLLPMLSMPFVAAWGFTRLLRRRPLAVVGATLVFVLNPFMIERMTAGQVYLVAGLGWLPLFAWLISASPSRRRAFAAAGVIVLMTALSLHLAFLVGLLWLATLSVRITARRRDDVAALARTAALAVVGSLWWIVPALAHPGQADAIGLQDLRLFRSAPDPVFGLLPNLAGLYGFWRRGWALPKDGLAAWPLLMAAILVVIVVGAVALRRTQAGRRLMLPVAIAAVSALFLAAGDQGPAGAAYAWAFRVAPWFRLMREPQKWLGLLALAYAVGFGAGAAAVVDEVRSRRLRVVATAMLLAMPLAYGWTALDGFHGSLAPSPTPASWAAADTLMGSGEGAVLALPWSHYVALDLTQGRVVSNPLASAFARPVLVSDQSGYGSVTVSSSDPRAAALGRALDGIPGPDIAAELEQLGVRYIVEQPTPAGFGDPWLLHRAGIVLLARWPDLALYRVGEA